MSSLLGIAKLDFTPDSYVPPNTFEKFIDDRPLYVAAPWFTTSVQAKYRDKVLHDSIRGMFYGEVEMSQSVGASAKNYHIPLYDFCKATGERMETIKKLLDAFMLQNTEQHHISGVDMIGKLYFYAYVPCVILREFREEVAAYSTEVIHESTAIDLLVRLGHIPRPAGYVG